MTHAISNLYPMRMSIIRKFHQFPPFPRLVLCAALLLAAGMANAEVYELPSDGDDVIGQTLHIQTAYEDTFVALARRYNVGFNELRLANPDVDPWLPGEGTDVVIPKQYILPDAPRRGIVVNLAEMRVYYYPSASDKYAGKVFTYPLSIGRKGWSTPLGTTTIVRKKAHPNWYPPASIRQEHAARGDPLPQVVPAGPNNPLGQYALYFGWPAYLMHGTNRPAGVGMRVSHGCLRMFPEDIAALFSMAEVGTKVTVVDQPYKFGWHNDKLYMEAHPPDAIGQSKIRSYTDWVKALMDATEEHPEIAVDWNKAQIIAQQETGIPAVIETNGPSAAPPASLRQQAAATGIH